MYKFNDCRMQTDYFYSHINDSLSHFAPNQTIKFSQTDTPWITLYFKVLIPRS